MQFTPIDNSNIEQLAAYYKKCRYRICDYSAGIKIMWQNAGYEYAKACGCLLVKSKWGGQTYFDYPVPIDDEADVNAALVACGEYCAEHFIPFRLCDVPACAVCTVLGCYPNIEIRTERNFDDYLYLAGDFIRFEGKKYAGQRNHIRKFYAACPDAVFETFGKNDHARIRKFWKKFGDRNDSPGAKTELKFAHAMTEYVGSDMFVSGGFTLNGEIISFCLSEICGETLIDHIEKALTDYEGIYPATVQEFAKAFAQNVRYINREDDAGNPAQAPDPRQDAHQSSEKNSRYQGRKRYFPDADHGKRHSRLQSAVPRRRAKPLVGLRLPRGLPASQTGLFL